MSSLDLFPQLWLNGDMDKRLLAAILGEAGRLVTNLLMTYGIRRPPPPSLTQELSPATLTNDEVIEYQKRELTKELLLLESHLEQGCKINNKACDCCAKHPIKIEGLALETSSMTSDKTFQELADWARSIGPITTEEASASGKYDEEYPKLAMQARSFRKAIMPKGGEE